MYRLIVLSAVLLFSFGCSSQQKLVDTDYHHTDPQVKKVLQKAFAANGGYDNYLNLKSISYKKRTKLFLPDGSVESDITQYHEYTVSPELSATIFWMKDGQRHSIKYENGVGQKYIDGELLADGSKSATSSFLSAHYVLFMPYKLADDHVQLTYDGQDEIAGSTVDIIKAVYSPADHDNHSTNDTWWYYFDADSGAYVASMVYHEPTYALIENTRQNTDLPLVMNTYRISHRVDGDGNKEYVRGEFYYEDYEMTFK
jgi:hypothetical protein